MPDMQRKGKGGDVYRDDPISNESSSGCYKLVPAEDPGSPEIRGQDLELSPVARNPIKVGSSVVDSHAESHAAHEEESTWACWSKDFLDSTPVQACTISLILANAIVIGLETDLPNAFRWDLVEDLFLMCFMVELAMRVYFIGIMDFFRIKQDADALWNWFDFTVVGLGSANFICSLAFPNAHAIDDATLFRMVRLLRILRVLRIIRIVRFLKQLYLLAYGFLEGTMAVFWVTILASFMLYICAVVLVRTYGRLEADEDPDSEVFSTKFGNIPRTMFSLFELMTAPDLGPYRVAMFRNPPLVVFLVTFIIVGSFGINGLLVALINESILEKNQARIEAERLERESKRKMMQQRCRELFDALDVNKNRVLPRSELMRCTSQIAALFEALGINFHRNDLDQMFYIMDYNDTGIIERSEFVQGVLELCSDLRPMSIMELHYQVCKCSNKVESQDTKVEHVLKNLEQCDVKLDRIDRSVTAMAPGLDTAGAPSWDVIGDAAIQPSLTRTCTWPGKQIASSGSSALSHERKLLWPVTQKVLSSTAAESPAGGPGRRGRFPAEPTTPQVEPNARSSHSANATTDVHRLQEHNVKSQSLLPRSASSSKDAATIADGRQAPMSDPLPGEPPGSSRCARIRALLAAHAQRLAQAQASVEEFLLLGDGEASHSDDASRGVARASAAIGESLLSLQRTNAEVLETLIAADAFAPDIRPGKRDGPSGSSAELEAGGVSVERSLVISSAYDATQRNVVGRGALNKDGRFGGGAWTVR